jgi:hypothetical protein
MKGIGYRFSVARTLSDGALFALKKSVFRRWKANQQRGTVTMNQTVKTYHIAPSEAGHIRSLANQVVHKRADLNEIDFLTDDAPMAAHKLPESIQRLFEDFKNKEDAGALHLTGLSITDELVGPTPLAHRSRGDRRIGAGEVTHGMMAPLVGSPFGWDTQQNGRCFTDVIAFENQRHQINASVSAESDFSYHSEDAFSDFLPDYLFLAGFRNHEKASTTLSSLKGIAVPDEAYRVLSQPGRCWNRANLAHRNAPEGTAQKILWGSREEPYMRINVPNVVCAEGDTEAESALEWLKQQLEKNRESVVINQGDLLVINNMMCVHARDRFDAIYGLRARWLSRLAITHDLRKSRSLRSTPDARVILSAA